MAALTSEELDAIQRELFASPAPGDAVGQGTATSDTGAGPVDPTQREPIVVDTRDPIEDFLWIKGVRGLTAPHSDPGRGRILVVAYVDVEKEGIRRWFNCQVNRVGFFEVEALEEFQRKGAAGRLVVKLIPWREGTTVRRWCKASNAERNVPGHDMTFVVSGEQLARK